MDADYTEPQRGSIDRSHRDRDWIRELIDKLVDLETANRANNQKIKTLSAENTQLRNNVLDDPNLRQAFLEAAHKDHQALVDRHAKSVEQYNSIIDQHLAINADLKAEVERLKGIINTEVDGGAHLRDEILALTGELEGIKSYLKWNGLLADLKDWLDWRAGKNGSEIPFPKEYLPPP